MPDLLSRTLHAFDAAAISYCLLRDDARPDAPAGGGEVDVLVSEPHLANLRLLARDLGYLELPRWGHAPHHFFVAFDTVGETWLKLDVVTRIAYGRPAHAWRTPLADGCLARRRRSGSAYGLAPEDGLVTLLLHCLLDKGAFPEAHRARLGALAGAVKDPGLVESLLASAGVPALTWPRLNEAIDRGRWDDLLAERKPIAAELNRRDRIGTSARRLVDPALRKLDRIRRLFQPPLPAVALLAPDGAGKSSLADGLARSFYFPVEIVYMGLYQQGARRSALAHIKGLGIAGHLATQWRRWLGARWQQGRDRLVVFDRYPYDAFLPAARREGALRRARRWLLARACPSPDMVVLLDAPGAVLFARKGEHSPELLEAQRGRYLALRDRLRGMVVVDATKPADKVRRDVIDLIWRHCLDRARVAPDPARSAPVVAGESGARLP